MTAPSTMPTCPRCGENTSVARVMRPEGEWFCSCGQLFDASEAEWHRMARLRREFRERRAGHRKPIKPLPRSVEDG